MIHRACLEQVSPPADHRVERPRVEGGQPSERSGAHGRGRFIHSNPRGWPTSPPAGATSATTIRLSRERFAAQRMTGRLRAAWGPRAGWRHAARGSWRAALPAVTVGVPGVSERGGDPPGPIPNPVVPSASAGEVLGGQLPGKCGPRARHPPRHRSPSSLPSRPPCRGVEQRQLVGLITQRSGVRIPPPLPQAKAIESDSIAFSFYLPFDYPNKPSCCAATCCRAATRSVRAEISGKNASNSAGFAKSSRKRSATSRSRLRR